MPEDDKGAAEPTTRWHPVSSVETRKFQCEVVEVEAPVRGAAAPPRLQLMATDDGRVQLEIRVPREKVYAVRKELVARGYRGSLPVMVRGRAGYGSWLGYLNELEVASIVVEMLDWALTEHEQAALDAIQEYGRRAPTGFRSPRLIR